MKEKLNLKSLPMWTIVGFLLLFIIQIIATVYGFGQQSYADLFVKYDNLLVPLGAFFHYWWVLAIFFGLFSWYEFFQDHRFINYKLNFLRPMSLLWTLLTLIWIVLFLYEKFLLSLVFLILKFLVLFTVTMQLNRRPLFGLDSLAIKTPFSLAFGWECFMLIQNLTTLLVSKIDKVDDSQLWSVILILFGLIIFLGLMMKLQDNFFALSFFIGNLGILIRQFSDWKADYIFLLIVLILVCATIAYTIIQTMLHPRKTPRSKRSYQKDFKEES